ncbi:GGDEF domain-containing protein [Paraglaciecola sp.]|uniref:GGDEF domain-containing protein n=1 Tax=Paraglaciecola sp. TaxID=1920173 RepID=UPI003EF4A255
MGIQKSRIFSRLTNLLWLFLPPVTLFVCVYFIEKTEHPALTMLLKNMNWLIYVCLGVSSLVAMQFGRSRLVYACALLVLFIPDTGPFTGPNGYLSSTNFIFSQLAFSYLFLSKDKGFSLLNTGASLLVLGSLWFITFLSAPEINLASQPLLLIIDEFLLNISRYTNTVFQPVEMLFFCIAALIGLVRFVVKLDNTHNALFLILLIISFVHFSINNQLTQLSLVFLSMLIAYSVMKDSFTMAFKDELTTIPSRRALMQYVQTLGRKYTVVMSDIDHFKKFNDTYGHDVGDEVLKLVASKLNKVLGGGKTFRYGGEEFVIIFPRKTAKEAVPFVEIVRQVIADYDVAIRTKPRPAKAPKTKSKPKKEKIVKVTTSFGIAQRTKEAAEFEQVMKQADLALYAAKKAGRNCVKVAKQ